MLRKLQVQADALHQLDTGVKEWIETLNTHEKECLAAWCRAEIAGQDDGPEGFGCFYQLIFGRPLPEHARKEWLPLIYAARRAGKGALIEAFRGASKSTTLSVAWTAFRIGHHPERANLVIQVSDAAARDTCRQVADLIANHAAWKAIFPFVIPDARAGWGLQGYNVQRTIMPYAEWRATAAASKGKDPNGVLLIDDIHDENNTRYLHVQTPVEREGVPVWPERFPPEEIERRRQESGTVEFARMYLLDLAAAAGAHLRREWLNRYPLTRIDPDWPVVLGVDYASTADQLKSRNRDYFAVAIGRALPGGTGMVLVDGYRGKVSQGEAVLRIQQIAERYPSLEMIEVEAHGKGEEFYHLLLRSSYLPLQPTYTGRVSKGERFEKGMGPLFQTKRAWVSDVETPFLRAFEQEWVSWPRGPHDDTLDAVFWMLYVGSPHLMLPNRTVSKRKNPFTQLSGS